MAGFDIRSNELKELEVCMTGEKSSTRHNYNEELHRSSALLLLLVIRQSQGQTDSRFGGSCKKKRTLLLEQKGRIWIGCRILETVFEYIAWARNIDVPHLWIQQEFIRERDSKFILCSIENQAEDIFRRSLVPPLFENFQNKTWTDIIKGSGIMWPITYSFWSVLLLWYHLLYLTPK